MQDPVRSTCGFAEIPAAVPDTWASGGASSLSTTSGAAKISVATLNRAVATLPFVFERPAADFRPLQAAAALKTIFPRASPAARFRGRETISTS